MAEKIKLEDPDGIHKTSNSEMKAYAPLVSHDDKDKYTKQVTENVKKLFKDLRSKPLIINTDAKYYELKITGSYAINSVSTVDPYNYKITISEQTIKECGLDTIGSILLHQLSHAARPYHYHDLVWQHYIKTIGGDPRVRNCGIINRANYPYILCCSNCYCIDSQSELRKNIGVSKKCIRCKKQKVHIPT